MANLKAKLPPTSLPDIAKAIDKAIGRPISDPKERATAAATANALSGEMNFPQIEKAFQISRDEIQSFIQRLFPDDTDKFLFLEQVAQQNAILSASVFTTRFAELSAIDAARAFAIFSGKAVEIRKAREAGFKEPPLPIATLVALEKTLNRLRPEKTLDAVIIKPEHAPKQQPQTSTEEKVPTTT